MTSSGVSILPMVPKPGRMPSQFDVTMNMKMVSASGRNRLPFSGPAMLVARSEKNSITASNRFWSPCRHFGHPAGCQVGEHRQHDDSEEGGDHGVGELEAGEELVREYGLRGQLDVSDRGGQESAAELVAQRASRQADDEKDEYAHDDGQSLGTLEELGHYPSPSSPGSEASDSTTMSIRNIPIIASAIPRPSPIIVNTGLRSNLLSIQSPPAAPASYADGDVPADSHEPGEPSLIWGNPQAPPEVCVVYHKDVVRVKLGGGLAYSELGRAVDSPDRLISAGALSRKQLRFDKELLAHVSPRLGRLRSGS